MEEFLANYKTSSKDQFKLNDSGRESFERSLISSSWSEKYDNLIKNFPLENFFLPEDTVTVDYFKKLKTIGALIIDSHLKYFMISDLNFSKLIPEAIWYFLKIASLEEINGFIEFFSTPSRRERAVGILIEESRDALKKTLCYAERLNLLLKTRNFYDDFSEANHGALRRDAQYKQHILSEYMDNFVINWAFLMKDCGEEELLFDALKCRFESILLKQLNDNAFHEKIKSAQIAANSAKLYFSFEEFQNFKKLLDDKNNLKSAFKAASKIKSGGVYERYDNKLSFDFFLKDSRRSAFRIITRALDAYSGALNAAEYKTEETSILELISPAFSNAQAMAENELKKEAMLWLGESAVIEQILDESILVETKLVTFDQNRNLSLQAIEKNSIHSKLDAFGNLHAAFLCQIDAKKDRILKMTLLLSPAYDKINNRIIFHEDFTPIEISYAKGVILHKKIFEYDQFNTCYGSKDGIHRSETHNPYSMAIIKRFSDDINRIINADQVSKKDF